jgi:DNA mismatch repair ATPase MutL
MAINEYKQLSDEEMIKLNNELINCDQPSFSPKGKPIMVNFNIDEIDKFFK